MNTQVNLSQRKFNFRFIITAWLLTIPFAFLVSLHYLTPYTIPSSAGSWFFYIIANIGEMSLLSFVFIFVINSIINLIIPNKKLIIITTVITASILISCIFIDSTVYQMYRTHINLTLFQMIISPQSADMFKLSVNETLLALLIIIAIIAVQSLIIFSSYKICGRQHKRRWTWVSGIGVFICLICSHLIYAWADATYYQPVLFAAESIPVYFGLTAKSVITKYNLTKIKYRPVVSTDTIHTNIKYPTHKLTFNPVKKPLNILIIGIDTWRYDTMTAENTPNIYNFSRNAWRFENHYSGGNCTTAGLFSMFYGLPDSYYQSFAQSGVGPVFFKTLLKDGYSLGIYFGAHGNLRNISRNAFIDVKNMNVEIPGSDSPETDKNATKLIEKYISQQVKNKKPFFGFIFYDSVHAHAYPQKGFKPKFLPSHGVNRLLIEQGKKSMTPYWNQYRNAVYYDDQLSGNIIDFIKEKGLLKNTIVIITSDHGEEFNDNHMGFWGHNGNFTPTQTHVPFIVYWPGRSTSKSIHHLTSHFDIVPTLLHDLLNNTNPLPDYTIGNNLTHKGDRSFLVLGSYSHIGIVQHDKNRITTIARAGIYDITDLHAHPIPNAKLDIPVLSKSFVLMRKYYK